MELLPMPRDPQISQPIADGPNPASTRWRACAVAPILARLAKHLALLASVLIIGGALGKSLSAQIAVFIVVVAATFLHSIARTLQRRPTVSGPPPRVAS